MRVLGVSLVAVVCTLAACKAEPNLPSGAVLLYDVDFSSPANTVGAAPKLADPPGAEPAPRKGPSEIFMGEPKVVDALCGLDDQPIRLAAASGTQGYEGLFFVIDTYHGHYRIELDVCVQSIGAPPLQANEPQLAIFVDMPKAYALGFFEKGRLVMIDQARGIDAIANPVVIGAYEPGKPMRIAIDVDVSGESWAISADGKQLYSGKIGPVVPSAVRTVIRGNNANVAAIDNFVVWAENDLSETGSELESEGDPEQSEGSAEVPR